MRHYHVAAGLSPSNVIVQEAQFDNVSEAAQAFIAVGKALHGSRAVHLNPVMVEAALVTYEDNHDEEIMVVVDNDTPFRVYFTVCDGCTTLAWRN